MKARKYMESNRWGVYIPDFSPEKVSAVMLLAKKNRLSTGAYIASLLDRELEKSTADPTCPNDDSGKIRDGLPG